MVLEFQTCIMVCRGRGRGETPVSKRLSPPPSMLQCSDCRETSNALATSKLHPSKGQRVTHLELKCKLIWFAVMVSRDHHQAKAEDFPLLRTGKWKQDPQILHPSKSKQQTKRNQKCNRLINRANLYHEISKHGKQAKSKEVKREQCKIHEKQGCKGRTSHQANKPNQEDETENEHIEEKFTSNLRKYEKETLCPRVF